MTVRRETLFWGAVVAGLVGTVWLLSDVLLPFVLGMANGRTSSIRSSFDSHAMDSREAPRRRC